MFPSGGIALHKLVGLPILKASRTGKSGKNVPCPVSFSQSCPQDTSVDLAKYTLYSGIHPTCYETGILLQSLVEMHPENIVRCAFYYRAVLHKKEKHMI